MQEGSKKENSCCYYDRFGLRSVCERHRFALAWVARYVIWTALICTKKSRHKNRKFHFGYMDKDESDAQILAKYIDRELFLGGCIVISHKK